MLEQKKTVLEQKNTVLEQEKTVLEQEKNALMEQQLRERENAEKASASAKASNKVL